MANRIGSNNAPLMYRLANLKILFHIFGKFEPNQLINSKLLDWWRSRLCSSIYFSWLKIICKWFSQKKILKRIKIWLNRPIWSPKNCFTLIAIQCTPLIYTHIYVLGPILSQLPVKKCLIDQGCLLTIKLMLISIKNHNII